MNAAELRAKRANLIREYREIVARQDVGAEDLERADKLWADAEKLLRQAEMLERGDAAEKELGESMGAHKPEPEHDPAPVDEQRKIDLFKRQMVAWLTNDYRSLPLPEIRALQAELDTAGGYLRPPVQMVNDLIMAVDNQVFMRQWGTKFTVAQAEELGVPTLENDPADADWTSELATGNEDTTMSFGRRALHPRPLAKRIKISRKLLRAVPNADVIVRDRLAYKFAISQEKAFLTGSGAQQPLGVFTASDLGISTRRDVSTGNTETAVTFDGLIEAKYKLDAQYWPRARWLAHSDFYKMVSKITDGNDQYVWRESVRVGEPDTILGIPTFTSAYAPNTFASGLYVAMLADFSHYWIADAMSFELQLLQELYAESNQVGLIGRLETDGMPTLEEAFVRVKLG